MSGTKPSFSLGDIQRPEPASGGDRRWTYMDAAWERQTVTTPRPTALPTGSAAMAAVLLAEAATFQAMADQLCKLTGLGMALTDLAGNTLVATGWMEVCTRFHRSSPDSCRNCVESDTALAQLARPGDYALYRCLNGMWDASTPISVDGERIGHLLFGQFFFQGEEPDLAAFEAQAARHGFEREPYLASLAQVPRLARDRFHDVMMLYVRMAEVIGRVGEQWTAREALATAQARAQEERAAMLGRIAAGLAHEINNPLSYTSAGVRHVVDRLRDLPDSVRAAWEREAAGEASELQSALADAGEGARRVRDIVASLRALGAAQHPELASCSVRHCLDLALGIARPRMPAGVDVTAELPELAHVAAGESELVQALVCLLPAAVEGSPPGPPCLLISGEQQGATVMVRVGSRPDRSAPLPAATPRRARALELTVAHALVRALGGELTLEEDGARTAAVLHLPVHGSR